MHFIFTENLRIELFIHIYLNGGGCMICHFSIIKVHFFLLIEFHCSFSISYKILPDYVHCCCISIRM